MRVELLNGQNIDERLRILATAGLLSRSEGTVLDLYDKRTDSTKNLNVTKRIIAKGHESIIEHDYFVFGISGVSPIIEQTLIGQRLASYTVKSRREVDFSNVGYYKPDFSYLNNGSEISKKYEKHMNYLFEEYSKLVDLGIKKEDARFILPYCFHSELVMGLDGRTLERLINYCTHGKMSILPELKEFGEKLKEIVKEYAPYLEEKLELEKDHSDDTFNMLDAIIDDKESEVLDGVKLIDWSKDNIHTTSDYGIDRSIIISSIMNRYQISYDKALNLYDNLSLQDKKDIMKVICTNSERRELEQVSFRYQIPISLANLTHLTRHRMHSLMIPDFIPIGDLSKHTIPSSIIKNNCLDTYEAIYKKNVDMYNEFVANGVEVKDLVYFYLSGCKVNVFTNINGRALQWISHMRCCNKAQWEIRGIVNEMVKQAKEVSPIFGQYLGTTCEVYGYCPEKEESCKKIYGLKKQL